MKNWMIAVLLGIGVLAEASTWVLNQDTLEKSLPIGVTVEELTRVLELEGIETRFETRGESLLWKGVRVSISLAHTPFAPYHLWVAVDGRMTLDECTTDELIELYDAIWMGRKALADTIGATGFFIFTTEQERKGKANSFVGFEIIPSGIHDSVVMDALEKHALIEYVFYNRIPFRRLIQSDETIQAIREMLPTLRPSVLPEIPQSNWSQKLLHHAEAIHTSLESIHLNLAQSGALIEGEVPPLPEQEEKIYEIKIDLDKCAFCNPKVIQKQLVCEWKETHILMSHKPLSRYGNFLILPKRHQCAWDLTREEAIASFESVIGLKKTLFETTGSNDWICYIQDGPTVGQTVPHTHIHFFILPEPLKSDIAFLQHIHNQRPILSYEEMRAGCEKISSILMGHLMDDHPCKTQFGDNK